MYKNTLIALTLAIGIFIPATASADYTIETGAAGFGDAINMQNADNTDGGQPFTTIGAGEITDVQFCLHGVSSPGGNIEVSLYEESGGEPTGSALGVATRSAGTITTGGLYAFSFSSSIPVTAATNYILVANRDDYSTGSIRACGADNPPNDGIYSNDNGSSWTALGIQFNTVVEVVEEETPTASTTATSTAIIVDNSVQSLFYGYILFMTGLVTIIWIMRGRKTH